MSRLKPVVYIDHPDKLATMSHDRQAAGSANYSFGDGDTRYRFRKNGFWRPDSDFHFFRTVTNPAALALLKDVERQSRLDGFRSMHLTVLAELLAQDGVPHIYYEAVEKTGRGGGWPHWDSVLWPTIHCIRVCEMKQSLQDYIDELHGPRGEALMEKHDAPQYYCKGYRNKLNPSVLDKMAGAGANLLMLDGRTWRVSGLALRDAIDFLAPLEYSESHNHGGYTYDD